MRKADDYRLEVHKNTYGAMDCPCTLLIISSVSAADAAGLRASPMPAAIAISRLLLSVLHSTESCEIAATHAGPDRRVRESAACWKGAGCRSAELESGLSKAALLAMLDEARAIV